MNVMFGLHGNSVNGVCAVAVLRYTAINNEVSDEELFKL